MERYDVVVVGGGPAGGRTARAAAEGGARVLLLEEHNEAGRPVQCAGLVTPRVFQHNPSRRSVRNSIRGSHFHSPSDHVITLDPKAVKAVVVDRSIFDAEVLGDAIRAGADVSLGSKVMEASRRGRPDEGVVVRAAKGKEERTVLCSVLVGADGPQSLVRRSFGFPGPKEVLTGVEAEVLVHGLERDFVNIFTGRDVAPGYFAWIIPSDVSDGGAVVARVGLCAVPGTVSPMDRLRNFMASDRFGNAAGPATEERPMMSLSGGVIPLGVLRQTCADNVMLVGDAAAMAKPTSGGGVYTALTAGEMCGRVAALAVSDGEFSKRYLSQYHKEWMGTFGKEIKKGLTLRKTFMNLSDAQIEKAFEILDDEAVIGLIEKKGDIDYPAGMARAVLKKAPQLMRFAGPMLKAKLF